MAEETLRINELEVSPMKALEHWPHAHEAVYYGRASREFGRFAKGMRKWQLFFEKLAQREQESYQAVREQYLKDHAEESVEKVKKHRESKSREAKIAELDKLIRKMAGVG